MDRSLLILGAPGSGKTTLLLELARDLLVRASDDWAHPIPVVFPLSTWAEMRKPLVDWLQDELNLRYDVPRRIAREWVFTDQVLPLLDGLDEVEANRRPTCVKAINVFRQSHGFLPLAMTSRTADYEAHAEPLRLHGAILLKPLTRDQVSTYLIHLGSAAEPVREAIHDEPSLWELLDSPLLLNIVIAAYAGQSNVTTTRGGTLHERRDQLFGSYVNKMLRRRTAAQRYTPEKTVHWLSWLAHQTVRRSQMFFFVERLQVDWLPRRQHRAVRICRVLGIGLLAGVVGLGIGLLVRLFGLDVGPRGLVAGLVAGLAVGLPLALVILLTKTRLRHEFADSEPLETIFDAHKFKTFYPDALGVGLLAGMVVGVVVGAVAGLVYGLFIGLAYALVVSRHPGVEAYLNHFVLRLWLVHNGSAPWNYVKFLDFAAERILLRKVGGGYVFLHRMLMDYFAARYAEPSVGGKEPAKPSSLEQRS
jgi:DNA polymerase III delta prime subunit